jgi:hypothetical protein
MCLLFAIAYDVFGVYTFVASIRRNGRTVDSFWTSRSVYVRRVQLYQPRHICQLSYLFRDSRHLMGSAFILRFWVFVPKNELILFYIRQCWIKIFGKFNCIANSLKIDKHSDDLNELKSTIQRLCDKIDSNFYDKDHINDIIKNIRHQINSNEAQILLNQNLLYENNQDIMLLQDYQDSMITIGN